MEKLSAISSQLSALRSAEAVNYHFAARPAEGIKAES